MSHSRHCWLCTLAILGIWNAPSATAETVPSDRLVVQGPRTYEARIGNCAIEIRLASGDYFWTSSSFNDAVFYTPIGHIQRSFSPYLQKLNVESYSDLAWKYIKPRPAGERWFGLMCAPSALQYNLPLIEVSCPSRWENGKWTLLDGYEGLYKPPAPLNGKNWHGFAVISKPSRNSHAKELLDIKFCLFGEKQTIMGQSQLTSQENFTELLKAIQLMEFPI